jgi:DNA-binding MarR family transcriptional regulator
MAPVDVEVDVDVELDVDVTAPPELASRLRLAVMRLARRLRQQGGDGSVSPSQLSALATLDRLAPLTLKGLAAAEQVQPPTMTRVVACLEERGLVQRSPHPSDGRVGVLRLTAGGRRFVDRSRRRKTAYLARRLEGLTPGERAALAAAVPVLEKLVEDRP